MDDNSRRRRQEPPGSSSSRGRYSTHDPNAPPSRSYEGRSMDRYRPAPINTPSPTARGMAGTASYGSYYQEPPTNFSQQMPQSTIGYAPEYAQDGRQTQGYSPYNQPMIYNVPQAGAQEAVYETSQQFPSRQAAGMQMIPPDVAAPYFQSQPASAAAPAQMQQQAPSSSTSAVYQQEPADQRLMQQNYPGHMASMSDMAQTAAPEQAADDDDDEREESANGMGEAYAQFQSALRKIFLDIENGSLPAASESLLSITTWLLSKVEHLGLTVDNENLQEERIALWRDFNHAWLALCLKQKDMAESSPPPQRSQQQLLSEQQLKKMGDELVQLCNIIERHGLVDYEYGVWEERIIDILLECLEQRERIPQEATTADSTAANPPGVYQPQ